MSIISKYQCKIYLNIPIILDLAVFLTESLDPSQNSIRDAPQTEHRAEGVQWVLTGASIQDDEGDAGIIIIIKLNIEYFFLSPHLMAACGMASPVIYLY